MEDLGDFFGACLDGRPQARQHARPGYARQAMPRPATATPQDALELATAAHLAGSEDERLVETIRIAIATAAAARPVRWLVEREPTLALRILAGQRGRMHDRQASVAPA